MASTVVITGANSGIGKYTAIELARKKMDIVMLCRSKERGEKARKEIVNRSGSNSVELVLGDLASLISVRKAADDILSRFDQTDVLINNAGIFLSSMELTAFGYEKTFAINHLGHFLLTKLLFERILESKDPRIINVASGAHYGARIDFDNLSGEREYSGFRRYGMTKLANILFTFKLSRLLNDQTIAINALHPGFVSTNLAKNNGLLYKIGMTLMRPFQKSSKRGAQPSVYLASSPMVKNISGKYFEDISVFPWSSPQIEPVNPDPICYDHDLQDKLWEVSMKATGLTQFHSPR